VFDQCLVHTTPHPAEKTVGFTPSGGGEEQENQDRKQKNPCLPFEASWRPLGTTTGTSCYAAEVSIWEFNNSQRRAYHHVPISPVVLKHDEHRLSQDVLADPPLTRRVRLLTTASSTPPPSPSSSAPTTPSSPSSPASPSMSRSRSTIS